MPRPADHPGAREGSAASSDRARTASVFVPSGPQFWMRNRAEGPRRAAVSASSLGGNPPVRRSRRIRGQASGGPSRAWLVGRGVDRRSRSARGGSASSRSRPTTNRALIERIAELSELARESVRRHVDTLARAMVAASSPTIRGFASGWRSSPMGGTLVDLVNERNAGSRAMPDDDAEHGEVIRVYRRQFAPSAPNRLAFVYPGLGNQFAGMGRALLGPLAGRARAQDARNGYLRDQLDPCVWWNDDLPRAFADHRIPILGSVAVGSLVTDVLRGLGWFPTPRSATAWANRRPWSP